MEPHWNYLGKAGFRACGIHPFDQEHVLCKVRRQPETPQQQQEQTEFVSPELLNYLQNTRESAYKSRERGHGRGGCVCVPAEMSMSLMDAGSSPAGMQGTT